MSARTIRRTLAALLVSLTFLVTGCSSGAQNTNSTATYAQETDEATPASEPSAEEPSPTTPSPIDTFTGTPVDLDLKDNVPNPCKLLGNDQYSRIFGSPPDSVETKYDRTRTNGWRGCDITGTNHLKVIAIRDGSSGENSAATGEELNWSDSLWNVEGTATDSPNNDKTCMESNDPTDVMEGIGCLVIKLDPERDLKSDPAAITDHVAKAWLRYNNRPQDTSAAGGVYTALVFVTKETATQPSLAVATMVQTKDTSADQLMDAAGIMINNLRVGLYK